jgi:hypothetical protein
MTEKPYYLAGPMSGLPSFNYPAFHAAAAALRARGYNLVSPAELDEQHTLQYATAIASPDGKDYHPKWTWGDYLARDVKIVADEAQGIIFLPNWHTSRGAKLEAFTGLLCGHKFGIYTEGADPLVTWVLRDHVVKHIYSAS